MGELIYDAEPGYSMDDRTLAHIKAAVGAKLRRQESFYLSWEIDAGMVSIWISPSVPLQLHFLGNTPPTINPVWLRALELSSAGDRGMVVIAEADAEDFASKHGPGAV